MSAETTASENPRPPALPPHDPTRLMKNPLIAAGLTFLFPGVGQIYNGQTTKALVLFGSFVGLICLTASGQPLPFAFGIPFVFFFSMIDAYRSAVLINVRRSGEPLDSGEEPASPAWGWTLIVVGVVLLLNNLGWLDLYSLHRFWPVLLIAGGIAILFGAMKGKDEGRGSRA
jgi:hypothetical protein